MKSSPLRFFAAVLGSSFCAPMKSRAPHPTAAREAPADDDIPSPPPPRPQTPNPDNQDLADFKSLKRAKRLIAEFDPRELLSLEDLYWHQELWSTLRDSLTPVYYRAACTLLEVRPEIIRYIATELSETVDVLDRIRLKRQFVKWVFKKVRTLRGDDILEEIQDLKQRLEDDYVGPQWLRDEAASEIVRMQKLAEENCPPYGRHRAYRQGVKVIRPPSIATIPESPDETDEAEDPDTDETEETQTETASCGGEVVVYFEYAWDGMIIDAADTERIEAYESRWSSSVPPRGVSLTTWARQTGAFFVGDPGPDPPTPWDVEERGLLARGFHRIKKLFAKKPSMSPY